MLEITNKEWYINQNIIPDKTSEEYEAFFEYQKELCIEGCTIDGVFIPGKLYYHLNFWNADIDYVDDKGRIQQKYAPPLLRDNEWIIFNAVEQAEMSKKGLCIGGSRRIAKSVFISSYISHGATFDEGSQNIVAALNSKDMKVTSEKIDKGLNHLPEYFRWQRIEDNWKEQVTLGIKTKDNIRYPFSHIMMRNLDDGNNQEIIAGTKPRKLVIEEGGKGYFLSGLQAAIPGFTTPYGWTCSPIVIFTGGDMQKYRDAKELMFSTDAYNFLSFDDTKNTSRKIGLFMGNKYRLEGKEASTLDVFLAKKSKELSKIPIMVSNEEKADKILAEDLENRKKSGDRTGYLKEKMYFPKDVDDIFLNEDTNIFDIESAKRQKAKLLLNERTGTPVILYDDGEGVKHEFTDKLPITNYPLKNSDNKDAPIVIYEFPISDPQFGLYVAGVDSYRTGKAAYSTSLGAVYIYKRIHNISGEKYQDMFVASYCARPDKKETWEEQARLLIKYYNARTLVENDEISFIDYMISKGDAHYLERQPQWLSEIVPNTTVRREFGIHRSAEKIRDFLHGCLKRYTEDPIFVEKDVDGVIISEIKGMSKIFDPVLLEEIIQYNEDGNFDRLIAAELAIALAMKMNPIYGASGGKSDDRIASLYNKNKQPKLLFQESKGIFKNNKRKLFS